VRHSFNLPFKGHYDAMFGLIPSTAKSSGRRRMFVVSFSRRILLSERKARIWNIQIQILTSWLDSKQKFKYSYHKQQAWVGIETRSKPCQ
jgi:hypothetical protein